MIYENLADFKEILIKGRRILGIDFGVAKIGISVSDSMHIIATPFEVYLRRNISKDMGHLNKLILDEEVCAIVMGFPKELNGGEGEACKLVREFAEKLIKKSNIPIYFQDERFSTVVVTRAMREAKMTKKKRQSIDDKLAASYILQGVLDSL